MKNKIVKRKKAFLGAAIGAAVGLGSSIFGAISSKNAANRAQREQQRAQNKQDTLNMAANLSNAYGNQDYVDDFQNRITFKCGGKMNKTKRAKMFSCGGRKRVACGGRKKAAWGADDTSTLINSLGSGLGNIASSAIVNSGTKKSINQNMFAATPKENIKAADYISLSEPRMPRYVYACGGKKKRK